MTLGEELDDGGDPPRLWAPGTNGPGTAFTRSIGDAVAEAIGVTPEPEILQKELKENDEFIVLASDGVWEFLTNQSVADTVVKFSDPLAACRAVVADSYRLWLQYDERTDDITMILAFIDRIDDPSAADDAPKPPVRRASRLGSASEISLGAAILAGGENRPVRRGLSKEKKQAMAIAASAAAEEDTSDWVMQVVTKTPEELARIQRAVKANFLFQHLNETQNKQVLDVMKKQPVKAGDVIIKEGDEGDWFYVVDDGEYTVSIKGAEILKYSTAGGNNPCFGELALMYSKPRAATVKADKAGMLWAMDRKSFRAILMKSSSISLTRTLRSVDILKSLSVGQLQRLQDLLSEVTFRTGDTILKQGEVSSNMYVLAEGKVKVVKDNKEMMELSPGAYFGERALLNDEPRAANVIAASAVKALYISKDAFEEVLGPLQEIIDMDRQRREQQAQQKQLMQEAEGLTGIGMSSFTLSGPVAAYEPMDYVLATLKGKAEYTLKVVSKNKVVANALAQRVMAEKELAGTVMTHHRFVPVALTTGQDDSYLYTVFKTRVALDLASMIPEAGLAENAAAFYTAAISLALDHLSDHKIIYRLITADSVMLDATGYPLLMDMRYSVRVDPAPTDFCGYPHYLAPEQVSGQGHSLDVDFWALGILLYEMISGGANPWITGDPAKDSEVGVYSRISGHTVGKLSFPEGCNPSTKLAECLNELLHPIPDKRLGCKADGAKELRNVPWLSSIQWEKLLLGEVEAPHKKEAAEAIRAAEKKSLKLSADKFSGSADLFANFSTMSLLSA